MDKKSPSCILVTMKPVTKTIINYLASYLELQLFLMALSLPVLVGWGIPVTPLGLIGNIVFTPFLLAFLTLSCLIFITEICAFPNFYLIRLLEALDEFWHYCMSWAPQQLVIPVANPGWVILALVTVSILVLAHQLRRWRRIMRIGLLTGLIALMIISLKISSSCSSPRFITVDRQRWHLAHYLNRSWLYIPALSCGRTPPYQFVNYRVVPALIQQTGSLSFDYLIVSVRGPQAEPLVKELLAALHARHCIILLEYASDSISLTPESSVDSTRVNTFPFVHQIDEQYRLIIEKTKRSAGRTHRITISSLIDNKAHTLYDA